MPEHSHGRECKDSPPPLAHRRDCIDDSGASAGSKRWPWVGEWYGELWLLKYLKAHTVSSEKQFSEKEPQMNTDKHR